MNSFESTVFESTASYAEDRDRNDPLHSFRKRFHIPHGSGPDNAPWIYFTGHSLGLQPVSTVEAVGDVLRTWQNLAVEGFFHATRPWIRYPLDIVRAMAPLVGAKESEVAIMNALTVNLHFLLAAFYRPTQDRFRIIMERNSFPSDQYAVASHVRRHGFDPDSAICFIDPSSDSQHLSDEQIADTIGQYGPEASLVLMGGINYSTGQLLDMQTITKLGHRQGCRVGFDLAHAAGNVPLSLHDWDVDFAAWCTYKYFNAGPGGPGALFVHDRFERDTDLRRLDGTGYHPRDPDSFIQHLRGGSRFCLGPVGRDQRPGSSSAPPIDSSRMYISGRFLPS